MGVERESDRVGGVVGGWRGFIGLICFQRGVVKRGRSNGRWMERGDNVR